MDENRIFASESTEKEENRKDLPLKIDKTFPTKLYYNILQIKILYNDYKSFR